MLTILLALNALLVIGVVVRGMGQVDHWGYPIAATVWLILYVTHPEWLTRVCLMATGAFVAGTAVVRLGERLNMGKSMQTVRETIKQLVMTAVRGQARYYSHALPRTTNFTAVAHARTEKKGGLTRLLPAWDRDAEILAESYSRGRPVVFVVIQGERLATNTFLEPWVRATHTTLSSMGEWAALQTSVTAHLGKYQRLAIAAWFRAGGIPIHSEAGGNAFAWQRPTANNATPSLERSRSA
jgi:hypothetical protein